MRWRAVNPTLLSDSRLAITWAMSSGTPYSPKRRPYRHRSCSVLIIAHGTPHKSQVSIWRPGATVFTVIPPAAQ